VPEGGEGASDPKKDLKRSFAKPVKDFEDDLP
jgi:hypothetical protein